LFQASPEIVDAVVNPASGLTHVRKDEGTELDIYARSARLLLLMAFIVDQLCS
jgi:hypothetical protein